MRRSQIAQMIAVGLIASAIGVAVALLINWFPTQASTQSKSIDTLFDVLLIVSVPIGVFVEVIVIFSVLRFRMKPGQEDEDGPPIHGNTRLEVVWTAIPAILLVGLCSYAYAVLNDIEKAKAGEMRIDVYGQQFAWTYGVQMNGKKFNAPILELPCRPTGTAIRQNAPCKGTPIVFKLHAVDVLHSFWVPAFRMKQDAVPGITTTVRVTPRRLGTYPVVCAELCGLGHGLMRSTVRVVTPDEFNTWVASGGKVTSSTGGTAQASRAPTTASA